MITLDVTDIPLGHAHRGGPEDFRGGQRPVDALNAQADDSSYEISVSLGQHGKPSNLKNGRSRVEAVS